jgi:hypothetical protein
MGGAEMNEPALLNIKGFRSAHFFDRRHYKHWGRDLQGIVTDDHYLELARKVGLEAARRYPGTHVARRGNNDLIVYASTNSTKDHSDNVDGGVFMAVQDQGTQGLLITLFAPSAGLNYFNNPDQRRLM